MHERAFGTRVVLIRKSTVNHSTSCGLEKGFSLISTGSELQDLDGLKRCCQKRAGNRPRLPRCFGRAAAFCPDSEASGIKRPSRTYEQLHRTSASASDSATRARSCWTWPRREHASQILPAPRGIMDLARLGTDGGLLRFPGLCHSETRVLRTLHTPCMVNVPRSEGFEYHKSFRMGNRPWKANQEVWRHRNSPSNGKDAEKSKGFICIHAVQLPRHAQQPRDTRSSPKGCRDVKSIQFREKTEDAVCRSFRLESCDRNCWATARPQLAATAEAKCNQEWDPIGSEMIWMWSTRSHLCRSKVACKTHIHGQGGRTIWGASSLKCTQQTWSKPSNRLTTHGRKARCSSSGRFHRSADNKTMSSGDVGSHHDEQCGCTCRAGHEAYVSVDRSQVHKTWACLGTKQFDSLCRLNLSHSAHGLATWSFGRFTGTIAFCTSKETRVYCRNT